MADQTDVRRLRLQPGDILAFETEKELSPDQARGIGQNLRAVLDRAGHSDVPIWLCAGGGKLTVIDAAAAVASGEAG
jgi:hypothetical protein